MSGQSLLVVYGEENFAGEVIHPNAFTIKQPELSKTREIKFSVLAKYFPFELENVRILVLQQKTVAKTVRFVWIGGKQLKDRLKVLRNHVVIMKICPLKPRVDFCAANQLKSKTNQTYPWWYPFVQTERREKQDSISVSEEPKSQHKSKITNRETKSGKNNNFPTNVKSVAKGFSMLSSWATEGISKKISQATDYVGSISSESIELTSSTVKLGQKIADGGFSEVYIAYRPTEDGNQAFALKRCLAHSKEDMTSLQQEISIHKAIKSPYVLKLVDHGVVKSSKLSGVKEVSMLFPLLNECGSMYDQMENHMNGSGCSKWPYDERAAALLMLGVCKGLSSIHKAGYMHRDIKPHNVLFKASNADELKSLNGDILPQGASFVTPILMDLGSCSSSKIKISTRREALMLQDEASVKCSAPYRAPEFIEVPQDAEIDEAADIWSLGCMMFALTFGRSYSPFEDPIQGVMNLAILQANVRFPEDRRANGYEYSKDWVSCIKQMLNANPQKRPSIQNVMTQLENLKNV